jgi:PAS domain S-box-containing protein
MLVGTAGMQTTGPARYDLLGTLGPIGVPTAVLDRQGTILWLNGAALDLVGDMVGQNFASVFAPEDAPRAREQFLRKLNGTPATNYDAKLLARDGRRLVVEISSVPLRDDDRVVGVFGLVQPRETVKTVPRRLRRRLTPRQLEVLELLADGASTEQIQAALHLSRETVRNHVRHVLKALGAHSRLEAVVLARGLGLLDRA